MASESSSAAKEPTPGDMNFGFLIFKHMTEKPNIDWDAFAADAGFKNATVAATRFGQIRKKYSNQPLVPVTPKKSKAAENPASASKVTKSGGRVGTKGRKGKAAAKVEEDHDEDELGKPEEGEVVDPFTSKK